MRGIAAGLRHAARAVGWLLLAAAGLPLAFFVTPLLLPLWRWLERVGGWRIVGHASLDDWCYWAVYGAYLLALAAASRSASRAAPDAAADDR